MDTATSPPSSVSASATATATGSASGSSSGPSTELVYWSDTFLYSKKAFVIEATDTTVILDNTIFYPAGGGQPSDTGSITSNGVIFQVTDVKLVDRKTVVHTGKYEGEARLKAGDEVDMKVDAEKRILHAKLHSAGHLLDSALENIGVKLVPGKGYHYPDGPYVEYIGKIPTEKRDEVQKNVEAEANRLIAQSKPVGVEMAKPSRVTEMIGSFPEYLPKDSDARMVNVGGVWCPCGGTHVHNLSQIGAIKITKLRVQKDRTRLCYSVS